MNQSISIRFGFNTLSIQIGYNQILHFALGKQFIAFVEQSYQAAWGNRGCSMVAQWLHLQILAEHFTTQLSNSGFVHTPILTVLFAIPTISSNDLRPAFRVARITSHQQSQW